MDTKKERKKEKLFLIVCHAVNIDYLDDLISQDDDFL